MRSDDASRLARHAARLATQLERECRAAPPGSRPRRALVMARQGLSRKLREIFREHWDLGIFDLAFGSLKAFGVYPALYFAGLAWTIPLMEYAPLNTQLWTAGYLMLRRTVASRLGRWRYGVDLERLDALRDRLLGIAPRDARHLHRFRIGGEERMLRVRHSRWLARWERWRGRRPEPGLLLQSELRKRVADPEFCFRANPLRANPLLYEKVLLARLLKSADGRARLAAASRPHAPLTGEARELQAAIGEGGAAARARVIEQGRRLEASSTARLADDGRPETLALRWLHASYRRAIRRTLAELDDLAYRLLADVARDRRVHASAYHRRVRRKRAELCAWVERAERLVEGACAARSAAQARRRARAEIAAARALGLTTRRARLALWLAEATSARPETALAFASGGPSR